jgi:radical SAM-linked protein
MEIALESLEKTGYEQVSLLALSIGDYSCLGPLVRDLAGRLTPKRVSLSLPSLRVGSLEDSVVREILRVRKTGFTLAPEAASPRLRGVVNKTISEEELLRTAHLIARLGWRTLKLYFMIGLPTETEEEVEEIVRLAQRIRSHVRTARAGGLQVTVNVSTFVPKAHTPLQWAAQQAPEQAEEKQRFLRKQLRQPGFRLKWHDVRLSLLEGLFARGDRGLGDLLETAYRLGCRRDGWSEYLRFDLWEKAFERTGVDPRGRLDPFPDPQGPLPWDWIDTGMPREWFRREHRKALTAEPTDFACSGRCEQCGVCVRPRGVPQRGVGERNGHASAADESAEASRRALSVRGTGEQPAARWRLRYAKRRPASCLGHLETLTLFHRALRGSGLPIHYTGGEHPHPKMAFSPALPVGVESRAEYLDLWLSSVPEERRIERELNAVLPEGISVLEARPVPLNASSLEGSIAWMEYEILFPETGADSPRQEDLERAMEAFRDPAPAAGETAGREGGKQDDLRRSVRLVGVPDRRGLLLRIHRLSGATPSAMRVVDLLLASLDLNRNGLRPRILKTEAALTGPAPSIPPPRRKGRHDK